MGTTQLSDVKQVPTKLIDIGTPDSYNGTDVALAIKITKDFLLKGLRPAPIIVLGCKNGRYKVHTGVVSLIVAHTLGVETVGVQEIQNGKQRSFLRGPSPPDERSVG